MSELIQARPFCKYYDDSFEIIGNKDGLPKYTGVIPAPDCNHISDEDREKTFKTAIERIYIDGYYIVSQRRIRNVAFDKIYQRTSLKVIYRPCKTKKEIETVASKIMEILGYSHEI